MINNRDVTKEWQEYQNGIAYNNDINYYFNADRNYRFYKGDQWVGVKAGNMPTPVFNIFKPIFNYFVSAIMSQKVSAKYSIMNTPSAEMTPPDETQLQNDPEMAKQFEMQTIGELLSNHSEVKWEKEKMDTLLREGLLDACLSGDVCAYTYWDKDIETGEMVKGDYCTELTDSCNVFFGNPNDRRVEKQPYILIAGRDMVSNLREEAKKNGIPKDEYMAIQPDKETTYQAGDYGKIELDKQNEETGKCLYILRFWKKDGFVYYSKTTRHSRVIEAVNMDIRRYPIAWMNWENVKNCYHGNSPANGLISNQIYINKQFAMTMLWLMNMAYGKVVYDSLRISGWSNAIGVAQPVQGDITGAVQQLQPAQMNNIVLEMIDKTIQYTKDLAGANDGALGASDPTQASGAAIIAVQKQAAIPLETVQAKLYQFVEDIYNIWGEFILRKYNAPRTIIYKDGENTATTQFDSTQYRDLMLNVKIDVGPSSYWSEIASMQTLDNLLNTQKIDMIQYLDRVPNGMIPKKQELALEIKRQQEALAQQAQAQQEQQAQAQQQQAMMEQQNVQMEQQAKAEKEMMDSDKTAEMMKSFEQIAKAIEEQNAKIDALKKELDVELQLKGAGV